MKFFGGRYVPFVQNYDPLSYGAPKGSCYGYVVQWSNDIKKSKNNFVIPRLNKKVLFAQNKQSRNYFSSWSSSFGRKTNLQSVISNMQHHLVDDTIYELGLDFCNDDISHALGIRKLPGNEIEFFDPNLGIFIFPNDERFAQWLANHLCTRHTSDLYHGGSLELNSLGKVGKKNEPSIPKLNIGSNEVAGVKVITTIESAVNENPGIDLSTIQHKNFFGRHKLKIILGACIGALILLGCATFGIGLTIPILYALCLAAFSLISIPLITTSGPMAAIGIASLTGAAIGSIGGAFIGLFKERKNHFAKAITLRINDPVQNNKILSKANNQAQPTFQTKPTDLYQNDAKFSKSPKTFTPKFVANISGKTSRTLTRRVQDEKNHEQISANMPNLRRSGK